jgi:hypothetical protein
MQESLFKVLTKVNPDEVNFSTAAGKQLLSVMTKELGEGLKSDQSIAVRLLWRAAHAVKTEAEFENIMKTGELPPMKLGQAEMAFMNGGGGVEIPGWVKSVGAKAGRCFGVLGVICSAVDLWSGFSDGYKEERS